LSQRKLFGEEPEVVKEIPLDKAIEISQQVIAIVSKSLSPCEVVGSIRRKRPVCHDIDVLGVGDLYEAVRELRKNFNVTIKEKGPKVTKLHIKADIGYVQVDFYAASNDTFGLMKIIRTGSVEHNIWLNNYARKNGFRIKYSEGLLKNNKPVAGKTEKGVFEALGLHVPKPEEREIVDGKPVWFNPE
jgi:DNA polymerase/3'-5' exonuclease PolX